MRFIRMKKPGVLSVLFFASLAVTACSSSYYTTLKPSELTETADQKSYKIENTLISHKKAESVLQLDSSQGLLPGIYTSSFESQGGTFYLGRGRPYFLKYASEKYYLRAGGFWLPKIVGGSPRFFYVVDPDEIVRVGSLDEAQSGNTTAEAVPYTGLISDWAMKSQDGYVVLVPMESGFSERFFEELKSVKSSAKIVTYMFDFARSEEALKQMLIKQAQREPELRVMVGSALQSFDVNRLASLLEVPLSRVLSASEVEQCLEFTESNGAATLLSVSRRSAAISDIPRQINMLPAKEYGEIMGFFESSCYRKTVAFIASKEARRIASKYGMDLACEYAGRTSLEMVDILKSHGKCLE